MHEALFLHPDFHGFISPHETKSMKSTKTFRLLSVWCAIAISLLAVPNISQALNPGDILVPGTAWLGGKGVDVRWNAGDCCGTWGNSTNICPSSGQGVYCLWKWQCDELGNRLYVVRDWYCGTFLKGDGTIEDWAYQVYDGAPLMGMDAHANGSGYVPVPGDCVLWYANCGNMVTHLAVVDTVDAGHVYVCEQNMNSSGRATLNRSGTNGSSLVRSDGTGCVRGVVHTPMNAAVPPVIVDNTYTNFSASANWSTGSSSTDKYGTNYRYRSTAALSDAATWTANLTAGTKTVYVWYPKGPNRSTTAAYIISTSTGSKTVTVNQQLTGGQWVSQGPVTVNGGVNTIKLSCWTTTGFVVVADAVKWQ
ncbi:MAG: N-acetylmuramoyl-L-alanine amidase [Verrucomicrobiales bacterium]|nr:N-acetylmuramoyl-L-alanine amidase [Verrucomicrobiales bacterium]